MHSIMPPGWEHEALKKRFDKELRQARAAELAVADDKQRERIEKEIRADVDKRLNQAGFLSRFRGVLW
jgi:hypothetical protein